MTGLHRNINHLTNQSEFYSDLYEALYAKLFFEGKKICPNHQLVEDSIQDIFIYFINRQEKFEHVINLESYMLVILRRKLIHKLSKSRDHITLENIIESIPVVSQEILLIKKESQLSLSNRIGKALDQLPKGESQAIEKRFLKGFSYEEIASHNNSTIRTVYNQIHSGIKKLRNIIER